MSTPYLISYVFLWTLTCAMVVAVLALYHHFGQMYMSSREGRTVHGLDEGTEVAEQQYVDLAGRAVTLPRHGERSLVLFTDTVCKLCRNLRPDLAAFARRVDFHVSVVCVGTRNEVAEWAEPLDDALTVVPDRGAKISTRFKVGLSPFLILIGEDGKVRARGIVNDADGLNRAAERLLFVERLDSANGDHAADAAAVAPRS
jgi:hypothetical protein